MVSGNHFLAPFKAVCTVEVAGAGNFLDADVPRLGTFTQYIISNVPHVKRGVLTNVNVYCDSTNNTAYDLIISEGPHANDQESQAHFIFDSFEMPGGAIADATRKTFQVNAAFVLDETNRFYFTLDHAAAPGTCLGRLAIWGVAYF